MAPAMKLSVFSIGSPIDPGVSMAITFVSGVLFGLTLGPFAARLPLRIIERIGVLFVTLFVLNQFINVVEGLFFTTISAAEWTFSLFVSAIQDAGLAVFLAFLFQPVSTQRRFSEILREVLGRRRGLGWLWRFLLAGLVYLPVYFFFGMIVAPYVMPYYLNPALGLRLAVPGFDVILPLEVFRGLLYALTLFPLIVALAADSSRSRYQLAFWIILALAVLGSWQPMLAATFWPPELRLAHGLEITGDCIVYGLLFVWLMAPGRARPDIVQKDYPAPAQRTMRKAATESMLGKIGGIHGC